MTERKRMSALGQRQHSAVHRARGKAKEHECVDCGGPAHEWSQIHDTDGSDIYHFEARCRSCHRIYDHDRRWGSEEYRRLQGQRYNEIIARGGYQHPKTHTPEHNQKVSEGLKRHFEENGHHATGRPLAGSTKEKLREKAQAYWDSPAGQARKEKMRKK